MAIEGKIPTYDYLKINSTDLYKFDPDDQVTLLAKKRNNVAKPTKGTTKGPKKGTKKPKN